MNKHWYRIAIWMLPFAPTPSIASDLYSLSLDELINVKVISTASGFAQKLIEAPANISVVERQDWQNLGATTLEEAITSVPGLHITTETLANGFLKPNIRGISGDYGRAIKLMIDGMTIEGASLGGRNAYLFPLIGGLKQIEVVKGPGSAVYGSDALGGVIQLVTPKAGDTDENQVVLRAGEDDNRDFLASHGGSFKDLKWYTSFEYSESGETSGREVEQDIQTLFDSTLETSASNAPAILSDQHEISNVLINLNYSDFYLSYVYLDGKGTARTGAANALDLRGTNETTNHISQLRYDASELFPIPGTLEFTGAYKYSKAIFRWDVFPPNSTFPVGDDGNLFTEGGGLVSFPDGVRGTPKEITHHREFKTTYFNEIQDSHKIRFEAGYNNFDIKASEKKNFGPGVLDDIIFIPGETYSSEELVDVTGTSDAYLDNLGRSYWWLSAQDHYQINDALTASAGVRYDDYSMFGSTTNPRITFTWKKTQDLNLKLFYGTAFREPKITETSIRNNPSTRGNSSLKPESIDTIELAANYQASSNLLFNNAIFYYETDDLIQPIPISGSSEKQFQNTKGTRGYGYEMELRCHIHSTFTFNINGSIRKIENAEGEKPPEDPSLLLYLSFTKRFSEQLDWHTGWKYIGGRERGRNDPRKEMNDYVMASSNLQWRPVEDISVSWQISNALDQDAREYMPLESNFENDLPLNGRQHKIEFKLDF